MPRKTLEEWAAARDGAAASMRPRPDAAENIDCLLAGQRHDLASMRPRPDAAENVRSFARSGWMVRLQ